MGEPVADAAGEDGGLVGAGVRAGDVGLPLGDNRWSPR